jgi:hypothetical protein
MSNIENDDDKNVTFIGRTQQNENDNSTSLIIPLESAKELDIEGSKVSICLLYDYDGNKHLLISKYHREILIG